jgi:hypothetical protein
MRDQVFYVGDWNPEEITRLIRERIGHYNYAIVSTKKGYNQHFKCEYYIISFRNFLDKETMERVLNNESANPKI